jgi:hypothetical protein
LPHHFAANVPLKAKVFPEMVVFGNVLRRCVRERTDGRERQGKSHHFESTLTGLGADD